MEAKHITVFPTNVLVIDWPDHEELNRDLKLEIYKKRGIDPEGMYRSNAAGTWHSDVALLKWAGEPGKKLAEMFAQGFRAMGDLHGGKEGGHYNVHMTAWAMVYGDRGYASSHTHPNCLYSGVYYVDTGPEQEAVEQPTGVKIKPGSIEFVDTRGSQSMMVPGLNHGGGARFEPREGMMLLFPSWLPHYVHPVRGDGDRISIACNGTLKYTPPKEKKDGD